MAKTKDYKNVSEQILQLVGGKDNIATATHCVTRLRLNLKDMSLADAESIKKIPGVMGCNVLGGQFQIIIGQEVSALYEQFCEIAGIATHAAINENLDASLTDGKEKVSLKKIGNSILAYVSSCMVGVLPVLIGAAMCKTIGIILGPSVLNIISETSDMYMMFDFLYDACFYFLPLYLGYTAAKALKVDIIWGLYLGALIIVPDFVGLVGVRDTFSIFGLPVPVAGYAQTFLPVVLGVWIMSYIWKFLNKYIPKVVAPILIPTLLILIMTPIMFAFCAPIGNYIGNGISAVFVAINGASLPVRMVGSIILSILLPFVVLCGMHTAIYISAYVSFIEIGSESFLMPLSFAMSCVIYGMALGAMVKMKKKENKSKATSYFLSGVLGGLSEPTLYGICLKYKSALPVMCICNAIAGLLSSILAPSVYLFGGTYNVFSAITYVAAGGVSNIIKGLGLSIFCLIMGAVGTALFCNFGDD